MTKYWTPYMLIFLLALCVVGCADEDLVSSQGSVGKDKTWVKLGFGHQAFEQIVINSRSTLDGVVESQVQDLYALIFVGNQCIYNHYFGSDSKENTQNAVIQAAANKTKECWWVQNSEDTYGTLSMNTPTFTNGEIYLIANANAYTVNISPEKLGTIRTKQDLEALTSVLNGDVLTRYGYFPMVAKLEGMNFSSTGVTQTGNTGNIVAQLERLDAKVKVNVMAATGAESLYGPESDNNKVKVKSFTPVSWQVMNVPKGSFIISNEGNQDDITGYFNSVPTTFEESTATTYGSEATTRHSFSFYMLENRYSSTGVANYHQRDERKKVGGVYAYPLPEEEDDEKDIWKYAPENATYLILKGYLAMEHEGTGAQEVGADVTYYIHLGDFASNLNDFSIERNTCYTYHVTIKGVRNIELEVTANVEHQSGATGTIYATQDIIKQFDAHYDQFATFIDISGLNENAMSWYVGTPFGKEGSPKLNDNIEQGNAGYDAALQEYDYRWVWFMVNPIVNGVYDRRNQWYPGDQNRTGGTAGKQLGDQNHLMNVDEFVQYMREQKIAYEAGRENIFKENGVAVTIFVDEYYYEQHPLTGESSTTLWKQFVNKPTRMMQVLSASNKSADGESSITGGLITIRQKSIQTPYNINKAGLDTAWGCETVDEFKDSQLWLYSPNETNNRNSDLPNTITVYTNNTSPENGRYNTACMLGLINGTAWNSTEKNWETYANYERVNDYKPTEGRYNGFYTGFLKEGNETLLSSILLRNRDKNGNRRIDAEEMRWYIASIKQLYGIYIGGLGLNTETQLYTREMAYQTGRIEAGPYAPDPAVANAVAPNLWQRHIISSTKRQKYPAILWAEQALSISDYRQDIGWGEMGPYQIRCVRNLGMDHADASEIVNEANYPDALILYKVKDANGNEIDENDATSSSIYEFDLTNINEASLRSPATVLELWPSDEFGFNSRPYKGFVTCKDQVTILQATGDGTSINSQYIELRKYLEGQTSTSRYKDGRIEGYRVPNLREAAIMNIYCKNTWWNNKQTMVGSYSYRSTLDNNYNLSWAFADNYASTANHYGRSIYIFPVKDMDPQ